MPSLRAQFTVKLDASMLIGTFLSSVGTPGTPGSPAAALQAITDPTPADAVSGINSQLGGLDLGSLGGIVGVIAQNATSIVGALPIGGDIIRPVTEALETI